jgi:hypothetical protein
VAGVFGTPSVITFTQKVADTANQMTISGWTAATIVTTDAIDPTYNPNYKSIVKLYAQADESASRDFTPIATLGGIPNVDSDVVIDLRKAFGGVLQPDAPEDTETNGPTLCSRMFTFYWLSYQDRYGTTPEEYSPVMIGYDSNYNGALRGGMNWESWDADTVNDDYFTATTNKFFTNTGTRKVSTGQPEWLYFFNKSQAANLRLVITATFTDNTTDTFSAQSGSGLARGVYRYAVGYTQLDIAGNVTIPTGHKVKSYTVKVENTSGPADVSETMTFSVDHGAGTPRYIVFENQWSGFDTLRCIGEAVFGIEAEGLDAVGADDPDYAPNEGPIGQYHTQVRDTIVLATGFLTGPEMEWLRELAESDVVYLVEGTALAKYTLDRSSFSALYGRQLPIGGLQIALKKANWR